MTLAQSNLTPRRDTYRFGSGEDLSLQPGTVGWSVEDLNDPQIRALWDAGRYEIIDGVLTIMPPAYFRGGMVVDNLKFILRSYFAARGVRAVFSGEVDIAVEPPLVVRADGVVVAGDDVNRFEEQKFDDAKATWKDCPLTLPPTIVIESVSKGHEAHDRISKRRWYAQLGVPNYWIVDGTRRTLECLRLVGSQYETDVAGSDNNVLEPTLFAGLIIPLAQIWEESAK